MKSYVENCINLYIMNLASWREIFLLIQWICEEEKIKLKAASLQMVRRRIQLDILSATCLLPPFVIYKYEESCAL